MPARVPSPATGDRLTSPRFVLDLKGKIMRIKLLYFGEAVNIPKTSIGLGVGLISVWVDGNGFTSASNDLGALGYIFLETPLVDIGEVDAEKQKIFTHLHGSVVTFDIKPNLFVRNGGIARITMTVAVESNGGLVGHTLEFVADDCTGVSFVSNALSFSTTMLMMDDTFAQLENTTIVSEEEVVAMEAAPPADDAAGANPDEADGQSEVALSQADPAALTEPNAQAEPAAQASADADADGRT
jgi:hypothetical protein